MNTLRFNITLPKDVGTKLKQHKNHSAVIAESLREKFERDEKAHMEQVLAKAYAAATKEDKEIDDDWDTTSGDGLE
jgi:homoserine trans-succinylase